MWFDDYDEFMVFTEARNKAHWARRTSFEYNDNVYSLALADCLISYNQSKGE